MSSKTLTIIARVLVITAIIVKKYGRFIRIPVGVLLFLKYLLLILSQHILQHMSHMRILSFP
jgi:uncharacterized membrane protein